MTTTITSTAPFAYAALYDFIVTYAGMLTPAVPVFPGELNQYEPGSYIIVSGVEDHQFDWEAMNYSFIETYHITGLCTVYTGSTEIDTPGTIASIMSQTYNIYTKGVMEAVVQNKGGPYGNPVLGLPPTAQMPQPVYEIRPDRASYLGNPGFLSNGQQSGWQGVIRWSFQCKAYLNPA